MSVPKRVQDRFYFVLVMPVDANGHGPANMFDAVELTWEVWDQELNSWSSHEILNDAIQTCEALNEEYYKEPDGR